MQKLSTAIRVIMADDHEIFREGFTLMMEKQQDIELIGQAEDGIELLSKACELRPDIIITDIKMPKMDGLQVMVQLKEKLPHINVIAYSNYDEETLIIDMLKAGARGYLLKSAGKGEIVEAVMTVYKDRSYYCNHTNARLAQLIAINSFNQYRKPKPICFNERERGIITLICEQYTNKEIADRLYLSKRTVETHREHIMEKMEVKNIAGLVVYAIRHGLYTL